MAGSEPRKPKRVLVHKPCSSPVPQGCQRARQNWAAAPAGTVLVRVSVVPASRLVMRELSVPARMVAKTLPAVSWRLVVMIPPCSVIYPKEARIQGPLALRLNRLNGGLLKIFQQVFYPHAHGNRIHRSKRRQGRGLRAAFCNSAAFC